MHCDLIIPAYNEVDCIEALLSELKPIRHHIRNIIIADNNSTDGTAQRALQCAQQCGMDIVVVYESQRGYGAACLRALAWIDKHPPRPDVVAFLDADLSDDPAALVDVLAPLDASRSDGARPAIVIGSRVRRAEPGALNVIQRFGNGLACTMMRLLTGRSYSDLGPLRAATWEAMNTMAMADRTWGWTVEMQMKAALLDLPFAEVDVPYRKRRMGRSKISGTVRGVVKAGVKIIWTIIALRFTASSIRARAANRQ